MNSPITFKKSLIRGRMYGCISYSPKMHDENGAAVAVDKIGRNILRLNTGWYCTKEMINFNQGGVR